MKKIVSVLLCVVMLCGLCLPSLAAGPEDLPYADSAFFAYGEYTIHYRVKEAASPKGQIMMLHGFAESTYAWENLSALLVESGYTCVLADLPDFGYSSRETKETDRLPREEIVHALMAELSDQPWYLAGHSMGGYVALSVAETYPDSVKNLLLYGTSGNDGVPEIAQQMMSNDAMISVMGTLMELMGRNPVVVRLLLALAIQDLDYVMHYDAEAIMAPFRVKGTGAGAIYNFSMLKPTDYEKVAQMSPILFMNGDKDKVIADSARVNLRASLPEGSVDYIVEGGGHMFIENMADEAARVTLDFLSGQAA
ncbi:MAG: alpha/beta hydrolase [Clostridia bacterium]|nr:alpha/beta hydrolase [Clostridia bacterium]